MNGDTVDDEWAKEQADYEADQQRKAEPAPVLGEGEFLAWRSPRKVSQQALRLDNPLWHWLVRTGWSAYNANDRFAGPSSFSAGPMWCFDRFGMSNTQLPNGSIVHIGGEHEDHYDPDFFIYNDVIVRRADGEIAIYGYPMEVFPPTDFHSATLIGDSIFVVGCLGNPNQRMVGTTPAFRLDLNSMHIQSLQTSGEAPGWICRHSAALADDGQSLLVSGGIRFVGEASADSENIDSWSLNTVTGVWFRLTKHDWQRWTMRRVDRARSRLWDVRQALWNSRHGHLGLENHWKFDDSPDFVALDALYRLDDTSPPSNAVEFNVFSVVVDGLTVRFKELGFGIEAIVEGQLASERLDELQRRTLTLLARLEASPCEIEVLVNV